MKLAIVCGGREYKDREHAYEVLDAEAPDFIIEGGALGADRLAREWAVERGVPCATVEANWNFYGRLAGPTRNGWMLRLRPTLCIAFPGGRGTANMVYQAKYTAKIPVKFA